MTHIIVLCFSLLTVFYTQNIVAQNRIITLSGALSETVHALGKGKNIVAVDVTSEYPAAIKQKPRASRDRTFSLEGLLAFKPDLILVPPNEISYAVESKLKRLGVKVVTIQQEYSAKGAERFVREVADAIGASAAGATLVKKLQTDIKQALAGLQTGANKPKVIFIYARGVGTMSVAGKGSSLDAIISLAGGRNAVQEFNDFKPYSTEALIKANPDVLLLFDFGTSSLGGKNAVLNMPGVSLTNVGKNKRVISMDGNLLVNFSVRLPQAIKELNQQLYRN
ncbi:heme/hemin ABC transporter substrate-binding protein [Sphingobacterium corticibacterium]|uniref:Hemin ABC transporter substrate-binding protein n=1 Tax=Sphingobacterium corticibacterium TaxID=2484746 RepID=A0A4Q6XHV4_9SPHI|nr:ABC transporter substrate-binding protein [Sphingobacterium corticibacterium]RZF58755.1 hemin ABC transporter substrate-binding protein [Sphingobacterium corticibacterium]